MPTLKHLDLIATEAVARGAAEERERFRAELERLKALDDRPASELSEPELDIVLSVGRVLDYLLGFLSQDEPEPDPAATAPPPVTEAGPAADSSDGPRWECSVCDTANIPGWLDACDSCGHPREARP